jgi:hypothetical protein
MLLRRFLETCPNCEYTMYYVWVASSNTFDATFYSDWFVDWDCIYNKDTTVVKCPKCWNYVWTSDTKKHLNEDCLCANQLFLSDYVTLLDTEHVKDPNKEYYFRLKIFKLYNDRIRDWFDEDYQPLTFPKDKKIRNSNLERLIILQENKINIIYESLVFLSELYRESWRFDDCVRILDDIKDKKADNIIKQLRKACEEKNPYVMKIKI